MTSRPPARRLDEVGELAGLADIVAGGDPNDVVKAFAATTAFRAAEWEELTTENNPYRRPVRPDDLEWLDYSGPMPAENACKLSALLGHRMLRNVYDGDLLHLPATPDRANRSDLHSFHDPRTRVLAALARPVLEAHVFAPVADIGTEGAGGTVDAALADVSAEIERRRSAPGAAWEAAAKAKHRREAANFVLLQLGAYRPAAAAALGRLTLGEYDQAHPDLRGILLSHHDRWVAQAPAWTRLLAAAGLTPGAAAYWQLYLGSSLGRGNLLHHLSSAPEKLAVALGAHVHELLDQSVTVEPAGSLLRAAFDTDDGARLPGPGPDTAGLLRTVDAVLTPLERRDGPQAVADFRRGFAQGRWYADLWDADLAEQLSWADRIEEYQEKAEKIDQHLSNEGIEVDLDTFVESNEETSTTHVHDDHRLVMIEKGQMHFWNNTTHKIELVEGDKLLIPVSRLHGSTVLSGECTYHQPIIPDEMLRQFL